MTRRQKYGAFRAAALVTLVCVACGRQVAPPAAPVAELEPLDVTSWTDRSELYMEYPALVAGQTTRFAVHLTRLTDFAALNEGRPRIELTPEAGGTAVVLQGLPPLRPGAYRVEGTVPPAGRYRWALAIEGPTVTDRHDLGLVTVYPDMRAAAAEAATRAPEDPALISYLKEQQWTNAFGTAAAVEGEMRTGLRVPARVEPVTGGEAVVTAPAAGRFAAEALLPIGAVVRAGQTVGRLEPRLSSGGDDRATLAAEVAEAQVAVEAARVELGRAERLLTERAVPGRRVEDARRSVTVAEARLRGAEARLAQRDETLGTGGGVAAGNAFLLRAPIAGRVTEVGATLGASYDEGALLFRIVRTDEVELQALVPAADVTAARDVSAITLELPGRAEPLALTPHHMHDAGVVDEQTHALTVQFEIENTRGQLLVGQSGTAVLYGRTSARMPIVPRDAVLMEAGRPYVFVHVGGERFARRIVEVAARDGDRVGIRSGVAPGDRVVVRGAYDVQLASAAKGLPAEGHVH